MIFAFLGRKMLHMFRRHRCPLSEDSMIASLRLSFRDNLNVDPCLRVQHVHAWNDPLRFTPLNVTACRDEDIVTLYRPVIRDVLIT